MPIYADIARDLLDSIAKGIYPVGTFIPGELELAERYGVSRQTVRTAMQRLTDIGAVSRRPGAGTRVEAREPAKVGFQQTLGSIADLVELASTTRRDILNITHVVMDRVTAKALGCVPGSRWVCLTYRRLPPSSSSTPIALVHCYVEEMYATVFTDLTPESGLISVLIESQFGIVTSEVRQSVRATLLDAKKAEVLEAQSGQAALEVIRRYSDNSGRIYEVSVSISPADRYAVTSVLSRIRPNV
jgi:GntR family transcriptional regulator